MAHKPSWLLAWLALPLLLFAFAACKSGDSKSDAGLDFRANPEGGSITKSRICDAYLTCLAAAEPKSFPTTLQIYQDDGPCWKTQTAAAACEKACEEAQAALAKTYPSIAACQASTTPDAGPKPNPPPSKDVDILFMVDNSYGMESMQLNLAKQFPRLIEALRSPKLGPVSPGASCSPSNTSGCKIPNVRIGVISSDLGAGPYSIQTCETPGGDGGKLHSTPGLLSPPGCPTPKDPWISYTDTGTAVTTNVQNAKTSDPVEQVKEAFSCIAYLGVGGCGFEHQLESTRKALSTGVNPGFLRTGSILVIVLLTNEDDCSARRTELFDPASPQGLTDPLGPYNSFRCTEFGVVCDEKLRTPGVKNNCHPGLDWLYTVNDYVSFFKSLRPAGNLFVAAVAGPVLPFEVGLDGVNPSLKTSCSSTVGTGVPGLRLKAVMDGLGWNGIFNQGLVAGKTSELNICAQELSPVLQLIGERISPWY